MYAADCQLSSSEPVQGPFVVPRSRGGWPVCYCCCLSFYIPEWKGIEQGRGTGKRQVTFHRAIYPDQIYRKITFNNASSEKSWQNIIKTPTIAGVFINLFWNKDTFLSPLSFQLLSSLLPSFQHLGTFGAFNSNFSSGNNFLNNWRAVRTPMIVIRCINESDVSGYSGRWILHESPISMNWCVTIIKSGRFIYQRFDFYLTQFFSRRPPLRTPGTPSDFTGMAITTGLSGSVAGNRHATACRLQDGTGSLVNSVIFFPSIVILIILTFGVNRILEKLFSSATKWICSVPPYSTQVFYQPAL